MGLGTGGLGLHCDSVSRRPRARWERKPRSQARCVRSASIRGRLQPGDLFFAIQGDVHDGHKFVDEVLDRGASAAVVHQDLGTSDPRLIRVGDTLVALQQLAKWAAARWGGPVVGVTGSAGKTTTKDVIAAVLGLCHASRQDDRQLQQSRWAAAVGIANPAGSAGSRTRVRHESRGRNRARSAASLHPMSRW